MQTNNWYVVTGGPSVGKTTLLRILHGKGNKIVPEAARIVIDKANLQGVDVKTLRADEKKFQYEVLVHKLKVEADLLKQAVTFFDRGMHDTLAYLWLKDLPIDKNVWDAIEKSNYKKVFLLEPLTKFEKDYARTETLDEALKLHKLLKKAYEDFGMKPVEVPVLPPIERAQWVIERL